MSRVILQPFFPQTLPLHASSISRATASALATKRLVVYVPVGHFFCRAFPPLEIKKSADNGVIRFPQKTRVAFRPCLFFAQCRSGFKNFCKQAHPLYRKPCRTLPRKKDSASGLPFAHSSLPAASSPSRFMCWTTRKKNNVHESPLSLLWLPIGHLAAFTHSTHVVHKADANESDDPSLRCGGKRSSFTSSGALVHDLELHPSRAKARMRMRVS